LISFRIEAQQHYQYPAPNRPTSGDDLLVSEPDLTPVDRRPLPWMNAESLASATEVVPKNWTGG
jgi:hypothetical protein